MRRRDFVALCGGALASTATFPLAAAEIYPSRPITIIVPFGPGSGTDIVARIIGQHLGTALKANVVVDDRPGANGGLAAAYVAKAAPDGYTLLMATNSPMSSNPFLLKNVGYDPVKDFAPISRVGSFTLLLVVHPSVPAKTLAELIAYAKANPGKLTYASGNTSGILAGETLKHWAGIDILQIPYKSVPPALNDTIAGRVSMAFTDLTPGIPHVQSGSVRAIAITRLRRSALLPGVPTFDELGLKDFEVELWAGMFAPAGTPSDIVARLSVETSQDRRDAGGEGADRPDRLRDFRLDAAGARRLRQGSARSHRTHGERRRHRAGVRPHPSSLHLPSPPPHAGEGKEAARAKRFAVIASQARFIEQSEFNNCWNCDSLAKHTDARCRDASAAGGNSMHDIARRSFHQRRLDRRARLHGGRRRGAADAAEARAQGVPLKVLNADEAQTLEAVGDTLAIGAQRGRHRPFRRPAAHRSRRR